jgi:hypothetical protein
MAFALTVRQYEDVNGEGSVDILKTRNLGEWSLLARNCDRKCRCCGYPLDPVDVIDRCCVCIALESALYARSYWINLSHKEDSDRRGMGLDEGV